MCVNFVNIFFDRMMIWRDLSHLNIGQMCGVFRYILFWMSVINPS